MTLARIAPLVLVAAAVSNAAAQYTPAAGQSAPMVRAKKSVRGSDGRVQEQTVVESPPRDAHGNAQGHQYDLAVDGAFEGETVAVLHFYTGGGFDFALPKAAIREKGFSVFRWINEAPPPEELERALAKSSQLWIISGETRHLNDKHLAVIKRFFDAGHGVYIWGDNPPYTGDANFVGQALLGATMTPDSYVQGEQVVGVQEAPGKPGVRRNHLLTTGLEHLYEGHTVATILPNQTLESLIYGSAGNLIAASYDRGGKRAILDGGFTRLYLKWDTAGTARYVKNAAAWLANAERFGAAASSSRR
ncbi:MAG TPA: hypothetical protein VFF06_11465 [Polyangia bacterium]|nr:hypothetical protein [Polyangia bacterium]